MKVVRCLRTFENQEIKKVLKNSIVGVTIGNFDGIHLGHQKLFFELQSKLEELSLKLKKPIIKIVISFRPHPRQVLSNIDRETANRTESFFSVMSFHAKCSALASYGFDFYFPIRFTKMFSQVSAENFVEKYLVKGLNASLVVVGNDWTFGAERMGNVELLKKLGEKFNFDCGIVNEVVVENQRVSTGVIKKHLAAGNLDIIKNLLARDFSIVGKVVAGAKRGRELGFPTANINLKKQLILPTGVYVCNVYYQNRHIPAIANLGIRPTFDGDSKVLEVHLLDNNNYQLYSKYLEVAFIEKIRDEKKFSSKGELVKQIRLDIEKARKIISCEK